MSKILEIACFNLESAIIAQEMGADRIELCANYKEGGVTPSFQTIQDVKSKLRIPVHVIIRPRGGSFEYSDDEMEMMKQSIRFCKEQNVNGIVFGCLTNQGLIDVKRCNELISIAKSMSLNFHRAIDECKNFEDSIQTLIDLGFHRVLTSGGKSSALLGKDNIKKIQFKFGNQIKIMPGGGIRSENLNDISLYTKCSEFHSAAFANNHEFCDSNEIKKMKQILLIHE